ncbi:MAG: ATP-binding protein [Chitinophagaceae bacterium]|nr:MAG: ATP-binding protein [Chitinophagaceae bacterium]
MNFNIQNLGPVQSAQIDLKGLSVITGLNDTGKSFISKAIYSIIKTATDAHQQLISERYEAVVSAVTQMFSAHRQVVRFDAAKMASFNPNIVIRSLAAVMRNGSVQATEDILQEYYHRIRADIEYMDGIMASSVTKEQALTRIQNAFHTGYRVINNEVEEQSVYKDFFDKIVIEKVFQGEINSIHPGYENMQIDVSEGATDLLSISVTHNHTEQFLLQNLVLLQDATIVETPMILQLAKFITSSLAFPTVPLGDETRLYQQRSDLPYYYYDLLLKLNLGTTVSDKHVAICEKIRKTIGGSVSYKLEESSFVFTKDSGEEIPASNMATGIKSFGLLLLLLKSGAINESTLLIIDEPEVHLHPKWEILYAEIIVMLSDTGVPIMVSSHSPYFLRALTVYIKQYKTQEISRFYYGQKLENQMSVFTDVTADLTPVFTKLAEPMQDIILNP